eukprot:580326-Lingulodinium_polyedra.AAC.1
MVALLRGQARSSKQWCSAVPRQLWPRSALVAQADVGIGIVAAGPNHAQLSPWWSQRDASHERAVR